MKTMKLIQILFALAAIYDGVLGIAFCFFPSAVFEFGGITPPNHMGYVQFPALLLIVFAVLFVHVAVRPRDGRILVPYGIGLKIAYVAVAGGHWMANGVPAIWKPFVIADIVFLVLFVVAWRALMTARSRDS